MRGKEEKWVGSIKGNCPLCYSRQCLCLRNFTSTYSTVVLDVVIVVVIVIVVVVVVVAAVVVIVEVGFEYRINKKNHVLCDGIGNGRDGVGLCLNELLLFLQFSAITKRVCRPFYWLVFRLVRLPASCTFFSVS